MRLLHHPTTVKPVGTLTTSGRTSRVPLTRSQRESGPILPVQACLGRSKRQSKDRLSAPCAGLFKSACADGPARDRQLIRSPSPWARQASKSNAVGDLRSSADASTSTCQTASAPSALEMRGTGRTIPARAVDPTWRGLVEWKPPYGRYVLTERNEGQGRGKILGESCCRSVRPSQGRPRRRSQVGQGCRLH
jgi:hypothetical protein